MQASFWAGKSVLVTGHTGFKGSWLTLMLVSLGARVSGLSLKPHTSPSLFEIANVASCMELSLEGDIRDQGVVAEAIEKVNPEIIFHLAAQALVHDSYDDPVGTYATNVMGTLHLFEAVRLAKRKVAIVNVTSDKCYENKEWLWAYREDEQMGGYDPYSSSKGCAELLTSSYRNSFFKEQGVRLASARAGNVIGGGDWAPNRLVPDILKAHEDKTKVVLRNPNATRPWQHVLEPLSGYIVLAQCLLDNDEGYDEGWNFGPDESDSRSVEWVAQQLLQYLGSENLIEVKPHALHEANMLKLDSSKARKLLNWKPKWDAGSALKQTANWYRSYLLNENMRDTCLNQIEQYMNVDFS